MTKRLFILMFTLGTCLSLSAQKDAFSTTGITDEMTVNPEQNKAWRMGQEKYSARPSSAWELGVHVGHFFIDGDVDRTVPGGYGLGLHLRKAVHYIFSIRGDLFYGSATGLETQLWRTKVNGGGLVEYGTGLPDGDYVEEYAQYENTDGWFPSHKTTYGYAALQGVFNIGNLLFHKSQNKWNWYITLGVGLSSHSTKLDLLDGSGNLYSSTLKTDVAWTQEKFDTKAGRSDIKAAINNIYDGEYETPGAKKQGIFRLGDDTNIHVVWTGSMGISRKLSRRINLGIEHQVMLADNDYLDGIKFRTSSDQTNNADIPHYTNLRLAINLGNFDKVTEPLYWLNPYENTFNDIAELKQRPVLDLTDEDGDGIIDMLDQELDTPSGCPVDTRGVTLDSDNDGLADCKDQEPYSPPGFDVDDKGVAMIPKAITEDDVNAIVDTKAAAIMSTVNANAANRSDCGKWFLPMIHYDLDKYSIKPEFYGHLHHVANVLKMCPELCVTAVGHTDVRSGDNYNQVLSYNRTKAAIDYLASNYGIDRSRIKLMYGGENTPLIGSSNGEAQHYMNRRVEFRVCQAGDYDMARPEGADAGSGSRSGSTGTQYSGNKNSGY